MNDSRIFEGLHTGGRRSKLTLHFLRALALCNRAHPYLSTTELPEAVVASVQKRRFVTKSLSKNSSNQRVSIDHPEDGRIKSRRSSIYETEEDAFPPYLSTLTWTIQQEDDLEPPNVNVYGPLDHHRSSVPQASPEESGRVVREELWLPEYHRFLKFSSHCKEDICCASAAAKIGFALVSRTVSYMDIDVSGVSRSIVCR